MSYPTAQARTNDGSFPNLQAQAGVGSTYSRPMDDAAISAWVEMKRERAINRPDSDTSEWRQTLWDYYMGEAYGDEEEGFSSVVTRQCFEVVEWMMPGLLEIFLGGGRVCEFVPTGEDDEEQAAQDTDVVNHLVLNHASAYELFSSWFRDALMYPNGYAKVWWEETPTYRLEHYDGLTDQQLVELLQDPHNHPVDVSTRQVQHPAQVTPHGIIPPQVADVHDVVVRVIEQEGEFRMESVPPEEVLVDNNTRTWDLDRADFVCHWREVTRSELIAMGYDQDFVWSIPTSKRIERSSERQNRTEVYDEDPHYDSSVAEMVKLDYYECYAYLDVDGDGFAEFNKIVVLGNSTVAEVEEWDYQPLISLCWTPSAHRHLGVSAVDVTMQTQRTSSVLVRQGLDNLYRVNRPRHFVDRKKTDVEQLLSYEPFGAVETTGPPRDAVLPEQLPVALPHVMAALEQQEGEMESRTGVTKAATTVDPDVLAKSTLGGLVLSTAGHNQRIMATARHLAETGVQKLMLKVQHLLRKHQRTELTIKLRGEWVHVDPQEWRHRTSMKAAVGIGTGNRRERLASAMQTLELQGAMTERGLSTPDRQFNTLEDISDLLGHSSAERYWLDPQSQEAQQVRQAQQQSAMQAAEADPRNRLLQLEQAKLQNESMRWQAELSAKIRDDLQGFFADIAKLELEYQTDIAGAGIEGQQQQTAAA